MAFYPIDRLKTGNIDFLFDCNLPQKDIDNIAQDVRKLPDRILVIRQFIEDAMRYCPFFVFNIIYDIDEFRPELNILLDSKYGEYMKFDTEKLNNILTNTIWGEEYTFNNLDVILSEHEEERMTFVFTYIYELSKDKDKWINKFIKNKDMHKRALFINHLIDYNPLEARKLLKNYESIFEDQGEIGDQINIKNPKINDHDLSNMIIKILHTDLDESIFINLKNYLIKNYKENDLAKKLLDPYRNIKKDPDIETYKSYRQKLLGTFDTYADELFETSRKSKFMILTRYKEKLSQTLLGKYNNIIRLNESIDNKKENTNWSFCPIDVVYYHELGKQLENNLDKYLSLSKTDEVIFLGNGSMSYAFKIGDYALKIGRGKWSYEDVICPDLYMILPNIEEYYVRDENKIVVASIEVQKYLKREAVDIPKECFSNFHRDLSNFGYYTDDPHSLGTSGENFRILDNYQDIKWNGPLPDHFKEIPLVLIDRDRVFRNGMRKKVQMESCNY